jgi:hypothetical protein
MATSSFWLLLSQSSIASPASMQRPVSQWMSPKSQQTNILQQGFGPEVSPTVTAHMLAAGHLPRHGRVPLGARDASLAIVQTQAPCILSTEHHAPPSFWRHISLLQKEVRDAPALRRVCRGLESA